MQTSPVVKIEVVSNAVWSEDDVTNSWCHFEVRI